MSQIGGYTELNKWVNVKVSPDGELYVSNEGAGLVFNQFDAIYEKDIDWENSVFDGWEGDPKDLFGRVAENKGISNTSTDNPKSFILTFYRPVQLRTFGLGAASGNFSNIKATILGSGDSSRGFLDLSDDDSKETTMVYKLEQFELTKIKVEFFTQDPVTVTNILLQNGVSEFKQNVIHKFGLNPDIDSGGDETVWTLGDQYIFTTTPQNYFISSSNAADVFNVVVETIGINAEGRYQREITNVTLQGQTSVQIPTNFLCVASNRAFNDNGTPFLGDIYIYENTPITNGIPNDLSKVRSHIAQGRDQTEQAVYTVPEFLEDGRKVAFAHLYKWSASVIRNRTTSGLFDLRVAEKNMVSKVKGSRSATENFIGLQEFGENTPLVIQPASDLWIQASEMSVNDVAVEADFTIRLVIL